MMQRIKFQKPNKTRDLRKKLALFLLAAVVLSSGIFLLPQKAQAATYNPGQIIFKITTDGSIYRVVEGQSFRIQVNVGLAPESVPVAVNDTLSLSLSLDAKVEGFYAGIVGAGTDPSCRSFLLGGCSFEDRLPASGVISDGAYKTLPFSGTFQIDTNDRRRAQGSAGSIVDYYPVGNREVLIFPVLGLGVGSDFSYGAGAARVRVEVYRTQAELIAAAKAACGTNPQECDENGNPINPNIDGQSQSTRPGASEGGLFDTLGGLLISVVNIIVGVIAAIVRWLAYGIGLIFVGLLESVLKIRGADVADFVIVAWTFVRDLVNMFFILVLIIIGFGTMLRIESYNYKKLLVNLILMAMLVNFSLVIGRIIIQLADVAQFSFLPAKGAEGVEGVREIYKNLVSTHITNIGDGLRAFHVNTATASGATFTLIFQLVFELAVVLTFGALAIFTLIATIAKWILLILSPFAYALAILPTTAGIARQWWQNFIKYVIFLPIIAFFLRLTYGVYRNALEIFPEGSVFDPSSRIDLIDYFKQAQASDDPTKNMFIAAITFIVVLAFLWAGMIITRQMGIFGASAIVGLAEKGLKAPLAYGGKGALALAGAGRSLALEKILEKTGVELRPSKWIEGWKKSREINREAREAKGAAVALDRKSALASPATFFQRYWHPEGIKRVAAGGEKEGRKLLEEAKQMKEQAVLPDNDQMRQAADMRVRAKQIEEEAERGAQRLEQEAAASPGLGAVDKKVRAQSLREEAALGAQRLREQASQIEAPFEDQRNETLRKARAKEVLGKKLIAPDDYLTQQKIREAIAAEKKTIHTNNWHELVDLFESAEREGKPYRAAAVAEHLTDTFNENELANHTRYTRPMSAEESADGKAHKAGEFFEYSAPGMENFRKLIFQEKFKLGKEASMMIMSDISDHAEDTKHFEIMRMYISENGKLRLKTPKEREAEVSAELDKMGTGRVLSEGNRLVGSREVPDVDYDLTESRTTYIEPTLVAYYLKNYPAVKFLLNRGQMNPSQAKAAAEPQNQRMIMEAARLLDDVEEVESIVGVSDNLKKKGLRDTRRQQYKEIMSQLIHYGATKGPGASGKSRIEEVQELFARTQRGQSQP